MEEGENNPDDIKNIVEKRVQFYEDIIIKGSTGSIEKGLEFDGIEFSEDKQYIKSSDGYHIKLLDNYIKEFDEKMALKGEKLYKSEDEICICRRCGLVFLSNNSYELHKCVNIIKVETDTIPDDINGKFSCPICEKKYTSLYLLGEHFTITHNNYDNLCSLDLTIHNGFPGFKILRKIGMIKNLNDKCFRRITSKNKVCDICYFSFIKSIEEPDRRPIIFTCCKRYICRDCLINYIIISDTIICPYCKKDHTRTDLDYIKFVDISNKIDKRRWIPWWRRHMDIFN